MGDLDGLTALVTGASGGIGESITNTLAAAGAQVIALDREVATPRSGPVLHIEADATQASSVEAAIDIGIAEFGSLHVVVCGVGASGRSLGDGPVDECTEEAWDFVMDVNLKSTYITCKYSLPHLRHADSSSIITMGSVLGLVGDRDFDTHAYAASKGGVIALTRAMAVTHARDGVRCNVICPGLIDTPMSTRARSDQRVLRRLADLQPITGAFGTPYDVASAALFLASPQSRFITGIVLPVDGGWTAQ